MYLLYCLLLWWIKDFSKWESISSFIPMSHWQQKVERAPASIIIQEIVHKACSEYIIRRCRLTYLLAGTGWETEDFLPRVCMLCTAIFTNLCDRLWVRLSVLLPVCLSVSPSVGPSVLPSVRLGIVSKWMDEHIVALCSHSLRTSFYSFQSHRRYKIPRETPRRGVKYKWRNFFANIVLYVHGRRN